MLMLSIMTMEGRTTPENVRVAPLGDFIFETDMRAGHAYSMFVPSHPQGFSEQMSRDLDQTTFQEMPDIIKTALEEGSVFVLGEPGSGKSHLVDDLTMACVANDVPYATLRVHINGGKAEGPANARKMFDRFRGLLGDDPGARALVVIDNVDYLGYKGHRSGGRTRRYAAEMDTLLTELVSDPRLVMVGTGHDDEWREGRWRWNDDAINSHAQHAVELFRSQVVFEGHLSLLGLMDLVRERAQAAGNGEVSKGDAARVVRLLTQLGLDKYFYAKHVRVAALLTNPSAEIERVEAGRSERKNGTHKNN